MKADWLEIAWKVAALLVVAALIVFGDAVADFMFGVGQ